MTRLKNVAIFTLLAAWMVPSSPALCGDDFSTVLKQMPTHYPLAIVVRDVTKLEEAVRAWQLRLDPEGKPADIIDDLKDELGIGEWIDFSAPVGLAAPSLGPGGGEGVLWVRVPGFENHVKGLDGAKETDGVWELPFPGDDTLFVKINGDYAMVSNQQSMLPTFDPSAPTLHAEMKGRSNLLEGRDVFIHVNFEPLRPMMLGGLAQASQMIVPMMTMALAQRGTGGSADTQAMASMVTGFVDGAKRLAEQISYLEIAIGLKSDKADVTLATGFDEGPIREYLAEQKPASTPLLANLAEQPFFAAMGCHFPGDQSPIVDYIYGKALAAIPAADDAEDETNTAATTVRTLRENLELSRKLYREVSGMNSVYAFTPDGMRGVGDFLAKDPTNVAGLVKQTVTQASGAMMQFGGGLKFESLGENTLGVTTVEQFKVTVDTANPSGAMLMMVYGPDARMAIGALSDRVRLALGNEEYVKRSFDKPDQALINASTAKAALAALPAKRNMVMLLDPAGIVPMIGPMMMGAGMGKAPTVPPGPPIGISMSLSGEPARIDIHIPIRAIERVMQAFSEDEPM
jgi:hypothetical protein